MAEPKSPEPPQVSREEQLAWEAGWRRWAVLLAALGAVLPLLGVGVRVTRTNDAGPDDTSQLLFVDENAGAFIGGSVVLGLGALAVGGALYYLYRVAKYRRPELPRAALVTLLFGSVLYLVGQVAYWVILAGEAGDFATTGNQTHEEAEQALESGTLQLAGALGLAAQLALGFAFVMIALNAMRAGLLTRFMGILGIFVGVLAVIPLGSPLPIVQTFWLGALAFLFAGRWPSGLPPAWESGKAEPWASQQELREQRQEALARRKAAKATGAAPEPMPATPDGAAQTPHSASKKRKRKKRR